MKRAAFIIRDAWQQIFHDKFMNGILLISLTVGMFYVFAGINAINDMDAARRLARFRNLEQLMILDVYQGYEPAEVIDARIAESIESGQITAAAYYASSQQMIYFQGETYSAYVSACTLPYFEMDGSRLIAGRQFTEDDMQPQARVCLINYSGTERDGTYWVGDRVSVLGEEYEIVGVIQAPKMYGSLLLPYPAAYGMLSLTNNQYHMMFYRNPDSNVKTAELRRLLFPTGQMISAESGEKAEAMYVASIQKWSRRKALQCGAILGFTALAMAMLLAGKGLNERYRMGLRLSMGARRKNVRRSLIIQNLLLMLIALVIDILFYRRIAERITGISPYLRWQTCMETVGIGVILTVLLSSGAAYVCMRGQSIRGMLSGRRV